METSLMLATVCLSKLHFCMDCFALSLEPDGETIESEPAEKPSKEDLLRCLRILHRKTILTVIAFIASSHTAIAAPQQLTIATGSAGWEYNKAGEKICHKLSESERFQCKVIVTRGSSQNIELLRGGKVNLALSQSDMIPDGAVDFISLKNLSRQALYVFVRSDSGIYSIHDLMHKRINIGPIGSGLRGTMKNVLKATGIVPSEASDVTATQEANLLCRNQTDAISFILDQDAPQVEQIEATCLMRRLGFSRKTLAEVMRSNDAYYPINLGSSGRKDAYAVGLYVDLITYKGALSPEDQQLIADSLRTMP